MNQYLEALAKVYVKEQTDVEEMDKGDLNIKS